MKRMIGAIAVALCLGAAGPALGLEGRISKGEYVSPGKLFRVQVPVMHNPFIKKPSAIHDERRADGGAEVNFTVLELGEAWRFGARPAGSETPLEATDLDAIFASELERWAGNRNADLILEEQTETPDGPAFGRIYHVEAASILAGSRGGATPSHQSALVGLMILPPQEGKPLLFAVGQFDMPNRGGHYTLDTERGRSKLAAEQLKRLRELSGSLRHP